jgi:endoglucanase
LYRTRLGDWATSGNYADATRASDWMTGHMRAYQSVTGDAFWGNAINAVFAMITRITTTNAPSTGLMPDFIIGNPARPAPANFLEAATDDDYSWNSCRYPWRMALDVAHHNSSQARAALNKTLGWLKGKTSGNPSSIMAGYTLSGNALATYSSAAFTAPFVAGCIADPAHQAYLNSGWTRINNWRDSYYGDSINLLCMLLISGNWWAP